MVLKPRIVLGSTPRHHARTRWSYSRPRTASSRASPRSRPTGRCPCAGILPRTSWRAALPLVSRGRPARTARSRLHSVSRVDASHGGVGRRLRTERLADAWPAQPAPTTMMWVVLGCLSSLLGYAARSATRACRFGESCCWEELFDCCALQSMRSSDPYRSFDSFR